MVSLWPWRGDDTSPASFEKSLSTVSGKITRASTDLDSSRQRARRWKALWTLYSSFAYILYLMIIGLVVGIRNCGVYEYTALAGGPVIIYFVRLCLETYYNYRLSRQQSHLDTLQKQRDTIITKLKAATRYDTTQQLLDKYGGPPARPKQKSPSTNPRKPSSSENKLPSTGPQAGRQRILPPPTANIPRQPSSSHSAVPASAPNTPNRSTPLSPGTSPNNPPLTAAAATPPWSSQHSPSLSPDDSASFAPNAFPAQSHYPPTYSDAAAGGKWYDRLLDVLLGEDETNAKNRLALICRKCRLVNGQAPPGVKRVEDVGRWRCAGCGVMNGEEREEDEVGRLVERIKGREMGEEKEGGNLVEEEGNEGGKTGGEDVREGKMEEEESDVTQYSEDEMEAREKSKSRRKGRKKG